ncbi:hypothetical protein HGRIS_000647 [Hohenbuehelia grisea]|uniref:Hydrophobic surface binding protein n=1 Tax=Hohenbuehelia grisea TaxID=104357 RepID=A0ABR3JRM6_9AGAR
MVQISVLFFAASLFASAFASPVKRTVAQVEADLADISSRVTTLDNNINAFPNSGGSLAAALGIHTAATNLATALDKGTTDVNATPAFSEADGKTILNTVQGFEPSILDALKAIVAKKPAFDALPLGGVSGLVKQDLGNLKTSTDNLGSALIAKSPADLVSQATTIKNNIDAGFVPAQAAYASA